MAVKPRSGQVSTPAVAQQPWLNSRGSTPVAQSRLRCAQHPWLNPNPASGGLSIPSQPSPAMAQPGIRPRSARARESLTRQRLSSTAHSSSGNPWVRPSIFSRWRLVRPVLAHSTAVGVNPTAGHELGVSNFGPATAYTPDLVAAGPATAPSQPTAGHLRSGF
ncbi:hypothetical protein RHGRI_004965 [Rhododendron griersonianum]|uniref:Uncharacterized protein n=1 Tax=Rhododendron griersonianum TaxID=479676 RepID=A0AAV6LDT6_9ERIC|nr:hypothetical protein RHGRI_004965 [Rhododendron griersonianum]